MWYLDTVSKKTKKINKLIALLNDDLTIEEPMIRKVLPARFIGNIAYFQKYAIHVVDKCTPPYTGVDLNWQCKSTPVVTGVHLSTTIEANKKIESLHS
jgi:hypothetical protein